MPGLKVTVDTRDFRGLMRDLKTVTKNLDPALRDCGAYMVKKVRSNIDRGVTADGQPLAPLAASTLLRKQSSTILKETGEMYRSIFNDVRNGRVTIAFKDEKYKYHASGTRKMPARPVLGISLADAKEFNRLVRLQIRRVGALRKQRSRA